MNRHKPDDRINAKIDVSQFNEFYKLAMIGIQGMRDEVDKGVILSGGKLPERRANGDRRK